MSYTKQNFWCTAPATMTSAAQFGRYFNFSATASYRARYIQLPKIPQKTSYSFSFGVTVNSISSYPNQVLMMDPETGTQIVNITGGKFGAYSTNAGDLTAGTSQALSNGTYTVTVSISNAPLLLITITTSGDTPTTFEAVRSTNATVINEFLAAMQHCPMMGVPYDLTNYSYYWRGYIIVRDMVITSGAETVFSAYETFAGDMKVTDYTVASGTPQISGATWNMLSTGIPQFKNVFSSDMDSFEIITKMTFFKSNTYPAQLYRGGVFYLWQTPATGNYANIYSNFLLYPTGSTYTDRFVMGYGIASDAGGFATASSPLDLSTDLVFGQPTWYKAVVKNNVGGSRVYIQLYRSTDKTNWTKIADRSVGNLGSNTYRFIFGDNWILSFGCNGLGTFGASGLMDLSETYVTSKGRVIWRAFEPSTGSVAIDKGYYNTGSGEIWMPKSKYFLDTLTDGQTLGWTNKLYAVTKNGQASARICEDTLTGDFQASHLLDTTVYLNYNKDLIIPSPVEYTIQASYQNAANNYNNVGSVTVDSSYVATGFSSSKYLVIADGATGEVLPFPANSANTWEMVYKIKYSTANTNQRICGALNNTSLAQIVIGIDSNKLITWISSNGTNWNIASGTRGSTTLANNTDYWVKAVYNGSQYVISLSTNGTTYTTEITVNNSTKIFTNNSSFLLGNAEQSGYLSGSLYLNDCYININGERWWTPVVTPTAVKLTHGTLVDSTSGMTYFLPTDTTVPLTSFTNKKGHNRCYLTNTSTSDYSTVVITSDTVTQNNPKVFKDVYLMGTTFGTYLPNYDTILGFTNQELKLRAVGVTTTNYNVQGSPTISSSYVASGFSTSNYLIIPYAFAQNAHNSYWLITAKVLLTSIGAMNPIFGGASGTYLPDLYVNSSGKIAINLSSNGSSYDITGGEGVVQGTHTLSTNTWYLITMGWTGSEYYVDIYDDDGHSLYPNEILLWEKTTPIESTSDSLCIGFRVGQYFHGRIDLNNVSITIGGPTVWTAITRSNTNQIVVDDAKCWSCVGCHTAYMPGKSLTVSAPAENSSYLVIGNTADAISPKAQSLALSSASANSQIDQDFITSDAVSGFYTGYTFDLNAGSDEILNFTKRGAQARVYRAIKGTIAQGTYYQYLYVSKDPTSPYRLYGTLLYSLVSTDSTPHSLEIAPTQTLQVYDYDITTDTIIAGGLTHYYIGDYMINFPESLNELTPPDNTDV